MIPSLLPGAHRINSFTIARMYGNNFSSSHRGVRSKPTTRSSSSRASCWTFGHLARARTSQFNKADVDSDPALQVHPLKTLLQVHQYHCSEGPLPSNTPASTDIQTDVCDHS